MIVIDFYDIMINALRMGRIRHPEAPQEYHYAFGNSVAYAVTRRSGGVGGPSMRQHLAARIIIKEFGRQPCSFQQAIDLLDECCYGPITIQHALMLREEYCFDDSREDLEAASILLASL